MHIYQQFILKMGQVLFIYVICISSSMPNGTTIDRSLQFLGVIAQTILLKKNVSMENGCHIAPLGINGVEQQMVITAEIFTVSQTLPFCCCQYQNTTESPEKETTTPKPVKSLPTNCGEAMGESDSDGIYQINVTDSNIGPFDVYCMKKVAKSRDEDILNGTWLVIQRRQDNTTNFYQNWDMYQRGFGVLKGNFWIGLDKLYAITKLTEPELWIQLEDHNGNTRWAKYSHFAIGNEYDKYALKTLRRYDGTAGDSLRYHQYQKWTTFDQDNDNRYPHNCAQVYRGAWWYDNCLKSNLNGMYGNNEDSKGIIWDTWHENKYSLKYVHMAIRHKQ